MLEDIRNKDSVISDIKNIFGQLVQVKVTDSGSSMVSITLQQMDGDTLLKTITTTQSSQY